MPVTFAADNLFNLAETAMVTTINADAWLGSTTHVALVHEKIRSRAEVSDLYYEHELPAIACLAIGAEADSSSALGEFQLGIRMWVEVWSAGADFDSQYQQMKEIVSRLRELMRLQETSGYLSGFIDGGRALVEESNFEYFAMSDGGWWAMGTLSILLELPSLT
jgi:hypothetical protein